MNASQTQGGATEAGRSWWVELLKLAVTVCAMGYAVYRAYGEATVLPRPSIGMLRILTAAGLCYAAGLFCCVLYWSALVVDRGGRPQPLSLLAAYFLGHLAKYLPGKVWVILVRATWPVGAGLSTGVLAATATQETLFMMGVGGAGGALLWVATKSAEGSHGAWVSAAVAAVAGVLMIVLSSPLVAGWSRAVRVGDRFRELAEIRSSTFLRGLLWMSSCWFLLGISLRLVFAALPGPGPPVVGCVAAMAVATVVGFVSMLPGGLGSRELVLAAILSSYGVTAPALVAAMTRLVWLATEIVCSVSFLGLAQLERRIQPPRRNA